MNREVRQVMAGAVAVAAVVLAEVAGAAAVAGAAVAVAGAGAGEEQCLRGHNDMKKWDTEKKYAADEDQN